MNFLAATFLLVKPEKDAFFLMMGLIKNFKFKGLYGDGMRGIMDMCKVFDWILTVYHPDLSEYFVSEAEGLCENLQRVRVQN